jgi:hypothetical protein
VMPLPWSNHKEYVALHDRVPCHVDFSGVDPRGCPHGSKRQCEGMIRVHGRYPESCPRFGGVETNGLSATGGCTIVLCKAKRYFDAAGEPEPTTVGTSWKDERRCPPTPSRR